ncbi:MAG TPA: nuclease-related domain-containing protein [Tepidisphaeraceae bacterium]|jgi:hypothetical protein
MSVEHKKLAGQWAKSKAKSLYIRTYLTLITLTLVGGLIIGYLLGARHSPLVALGTIPLAVLGWLFLKPMDRQIDKWGRERIKYMRGGQAEGYVAWLLRDLPGSFHVFHNLPCAKGGDLDHVVVGPSGLYVLSTKSYKGHVTRAANGTIRLNGQPLQGDLEDAQSLALWLVTRLKSALGDRVPWVQPVLVLPRVHLDVPPKENKVWILDDERLLETISPEKIEKKTPATRVQEIVAELERVAEQK